MYKEAIIDGFVWLTILPCRKAINPLYLIQQHIGSVVQLSQIRLFGSLWTIVRYWRFLNLGGLSSHIYVHVETKLKTAICHARTHMALSVSSLDSGSLRRY